MSNQLFGGEDERELNHSFDEGFNVGLKKGKKQGAVDELEIIRGLMVKGQLVGAYIEKRLKELKERVGEQK